MKTHVEVIGVKQVSKMLQQSQEEIRQKVIQQLNKSALKIVADAKKAAPVDSGRLRGSLAILARYNDGLTLDVGTNVFYAPYVEYGTGIYAAGDEPGRQTPWTYYSPQLKRYVTTQGMHARPFLFPAFERERPNLIAELKRIVGS
jgi:HK97 gp10 family phage protein